MDSSPAVVHGVRKDIQQLLLPCISVFVVLSFILVLVLVTVLGNFRFSFDIFCITSAGMYIINQLVRTALQVGQRPQLVHTY